MLRHVLATAVLGALAVLAAGPRAYAQTEGKSDKAAEVVIPPKHALEKANEDERKAYDGIKARLLALGPEQVNSLVGTRGFAERVGSQIAPMLECFVWGYQYSGEAAWLGKFADLMTALEKALVTDPDGNVGWYSAPDTRKFGEPWPPTWPDAQLVAAWQQAEARVTAACVDFALAVRRDGELGQKFGQKADHWIELCETKLPPKWKDYYIDLTEERAVYTWPTRVFKRGTKEWKPYPTAPKEGEDVTLPHPAISEIARAYLKLWQLKGTDEHRLRAAKLLRWQKSCLRPGRNDSYWWNYWDPAGDWDFRPEGGLAFGMYLSPEPRDAARDLEAFVEAYHTGTVIDETDIKRLVNTQAKVMLGGSEMTPSWKNQRGEGRGMLWPQLAEFDQQLAGLLGQCLDLRSNEFGGPLRFRQEQPYWSEGKRRKLSPPGLQLGSPMFEPAKEADLINWDKNFKDFKEEMDELIKKHPPPDPRKPQGGAAPKPPAGAG